MPVYFPLPRGNNGRYGASAKKNAQAVWKSILGSPEVEDALVSAALTAAEDGQEVFTITDSGRSGVMIVDRSSGDDGERSKRLIEALARVRF